MSLTLFFIVLSVAVGYLLYDTFKKGRQKTNKNSETINNRLKINYTHECTVLTSLSKQKLDSVKTKTISIHLVGSEVKPSPEEITKVREIIIKTLATRRIYLLEKKGHDHDGLFNMLKEVIGPEFTIPYNSVEGAVAILRQLSCGIHLQSEMDLHIKIRQYLNKIWLAGEDPEQQAIREFKSEVEMIKFLQNLQVVQQEEKK